MICPKCEEGTIEKILFKKDKRMGSLCDFCGALWFEGEKVDANISHFMQSLTKNDEMEYTFIDIDEKNEESKSVMYPKFR